LETQNDQLQVAQERIDGLLNWYRGFYENSPVGYFALDESGKVTEANETSALLLGVEKAAFVGKAFSQFVGETDNASFSRFFLRLKATGQKQSAELRLLRENSDPFYGLIHGMPINAPGRPLEICFSLVDVTKTKMTVGKLEEIYGVLMRGGARTVGLPNRGAIGDGKANVLRAENGKGIVFCTNVETENVTDPKMPYEEGEIAKEIEQRMVLNIRDFIMPSMDGLRRSNLNAEQKRILTVIEEILIDIASPLMQKAFSRYVQLTPREIQVAGFIRYGYTTKEIAQILNVTLNAVEIHRASLRKKFGLKHEKANLRSFLLSLPL
jgi:PAS domain S-box-containing protein